MSTQSTAGIILEALDEIVFLLEACGVPACADADVFEPPGAIVGAPTIQSVTHGGGLTLSVPVHLVTPDPGRSGLADLLAMLERALPALGTATATPTLFQSPLNANGLPAYFVAVTYTTTEG